MKRYEALVRIPVRAADKHDAAGQARNYAERTGATSWAVVMDGEFVAGSSDILVTGDDEIAVGRLGEFALLKADGQWYRLDTEATATLATMLAEVTAEILAGDKGGGAPWPEEHDQ